MVNSWDEAMKLSLPGTRPQALGLGWWAPGGYQQVGNQWVRPPDAPPVTSAAGPNQQASPPPPATGGSKPAAAPAGFDPAKWGNAEHNTAKYVAGRTVAGGGSVQDVVAALQQHGHQARVIGKDKIAYYDPELGREVTVDVIGGMNAGEYRPQWYIDEGTGAAAAPSAGLSAPPVPSNTSSYISDPAPTGTPTEVTLPAIDRAVLTSQMRDGSERTTSGDPVLSSSMAAFSTDYTSPANSPRVQAALADLQTPPTSIAELNRRALTSQMNGDR